MRSRWTIGKKLIVSFLGVAAITLILGIVGYYGIHQGEKAIKEIGEVRLPSVEALLVMSEAQTAVDSAENALLSREIDLKMRGEKYDTFADAWNRADEAWKKYEPLPQTAEESRIWGEFVPAWEQWKQDHEAYTALSQEYDQYVENGFKINKAYSRMADQALNVNRASFTKTQRALAELRDRQRAASSTGVDNTDALDALAIIKEGQTAIDGIENALLCRLLTAAERTQQQQNMAEIWQGVNQAWKRYDALPKGNDIAQRWQQLQTTWNTWKRDHQTFAEMAANYIPLVDAQLKANDLYKEMTQQALVKNAVSFTKAERLLLQLVDINRSVAEATVAKAKTQVGFLNLFSFLATIIGVVAAIALGWGISRSINKTLRRIASGLSAGADQTASAAGQVSSASQSLAQGASEQAASLEETTSSMEEMSSMTSRNADNAEEAAKLMGKAKEVVAGMAQANEEMSAAIADIQNSSGETAKIIKTIEEISFQTNLLALNAAVEAARAGEAGKGFAVVAEEVRNLAQRAAEAARDTATMIEGSVRNADNGVAVNERVAAAVQQTVTSAGQVNDLVAEIAAASQEQAQGIGQINTAMSQMDQVTQSNAANAEESASAAEELNAQAEELRRTVLDLQSLVGGSGASSPSPRSASATPSPRPEPQRYTPNTTGKATPSQPAAHNADHADWLTADPEKELASF